MFTPFRTICLSGVMAFGIVCSTDAFAITSASMQQGQPDKVLSDTTQDNASASATAQSQSTLDRSGLDRASVHLQILQQSNVHFGDSGAKKSLPFDKKAQIKSTPNS